MKPKLILSCEHGGNYVPEEFEALFEKNSTVLQTHRGIDFGTAHLFDELKGFFDYSIKNELCRLLIEFNRSLHHQQLFSEFSKGLNASKKKKLYEQYHLYRNNVISEIPTQSKNSTYHLSLHSFTPEMNGSARNFDVGILYDPSRKEEKKWAYVMKKNFVKEGLVVRMNQPYLGKADGLTSALRAQFGDHYLGIELELNQKLAFKNQFPPVLTQRIKFAIESSLNKKTSATN